MTSYIDAFENHLVNITELEHIEEWKELMNEDMNYDDSLKLEIIDTLLFECKEKKAIIRDDKVVIIILKKKPNYRLKLIDSLSIGGYGFILLIQSIFPNSTSKRMILKVSNKIDESKNELKTYCIIKKYILEKKISPNFSGVIFYMECHDLFNSITNPWKSFNKLFKSHFPFKNTDGFSYMGLEYINNESIKEFKNKNSIEIPLFKSFLFQLLIALSAFKKIHMIHGDISIKNILVDSNIKDEIEKKKIIFFTHLHFDKDSIYFNPLKNNKYLIKIIDFGSSRLTKDYPLSKFYRYPMLNVLYYPPEFVFIDITKGRYSHKTDVFLLGNVLYYLMTGDFLVFLNKPKLFRYVTPIKFKEELIAYVKDPKHSKEYSELFIQFITKNNINQMEDVINTIWNLVEALGLPDVSEWIELPNSGIYKLIKAHIAEETGWLEKSINVRSYFGDNEKGFDVFLSMFDWNPNKRPSAIDLLDNFGDYFNDFIITKEEMKKLLETNKYGLWGIESF